MADSTRHKTPLKEESHRADLVDTGPVEVIFDATEESRMQDIAASAERLLGQVFRDAGQQAIWGLREVGWPTSLLSELQDATRGPVKLHLLPLNRIGQMEGKSGSLVLIGYFK